LTYFPLRKPLALDAIKITLFLYGAPENRRITMLLMYPEPVGRGGAGQGDSQPGGGVATGRQENSD